MNIEDRAYRIKRGEQRAEQEARTEALVQRTILIVAVAILFAYVWIIVVLIKGLLFGKSKSTRILSALGLLAIAIGTTVLVRHFKHKNMDDHNPKTPMALYLEMDEQSFRTQCGSFLDSSKMGLVTPNVRTNLTTVLLLRDILRPMGVSDEAFKESYESGGFEGLFHDDVMKRVADPDYFLHNIYSMSELKNALDKCLSQIDAPYWKQQELKIRACLYFFLKEEGGDLCVAIIRSLEGDGDSNSKEAAIRALEAKEIVRVLKSLGMMGRMKLRSDREPPASSKDCATRIVNECNCRGITEKWIQELGNWCVAWDMPDNAPNSITYLVSPGFPYDNLARFLECYSIVLENPFVLVQMNGEIVAFKSLSINDHYSLRKIFDGRELLSDFKQLKYLTPRGILTPFVAERDKFSEHKSENVETHSMKSKEPISLPTLSETKTSKVVDAPTELLPVVSPQSQTEPKTQAVAPPAKNPHFEAARKHDWQSKCQKEWGKAFSEVQRVFSVFGGFQLAQPPIDDVDFSMSGNRDSENIQKDVPILKQYRYFQKADLEFFNGALVGFTLKAHFAKTYSKASIDREYKAFQEDVIKNLQSLHKPEMGVSVGTTSLWTVRYGESRRPSIHKITGRIYVTHHLRQNDDGYDLTMTVDAKRGLGHYIELVLKKESDEKGDELEEFNKKQQAKDDTSKRDDGGTAPAEGTSRTVKITGFRGYKFGQKYPVARMTAEMWQEGGLAIKPVQIRYRNFRTLELGYAIDGKQLCRMRLCAEFPRNADNSQLSNELKNVKGELEHQLGLEMTERGNEAHYEDENYVVKLWYQPTTKTVYNTRHVGFRNQRVASTVNIKGLYLLIEDKNLMP